MTTRVTVTGTHGEVATLTATAAASGRLQHQHGPYAISPTQHRIDLLLASDTTTPHDPAPATGPSRRLVLVLTLGLAVSATAGAWAAGLTGATVALALACLTGWALLEFRTSQARSTTSQ